MEIVVVLPAPFGPRRPYVSPAGIVKPTPSTAWRYPEPLPKVAAVEDRTPNGAAEPGAAAPRRPAASRNMQDDQATVTDLDRG